jgi:hypothetical protein
MANPGTSFVETIAFSRMPRMTMKILCASAAITLSAVASAAPALGVCKDVTVSAQGQEHVDIDAATSSAGDALAAKIVATYGKTWTMGSHRNGSFHCDKVLAGRKPGWTCVAKTTAICAPSN